MINHNKTVKSVKSNKSIKSNKKYSKRTYSKLDYSSGDGMLTSVWGPSMWHYLHTMSFNYPINPSKEDKIHYRDFVLNLKYVLPCKYCRQNLKTNFKSLPLTIADMKSRETFSKYIYNLHELVNKMLHKKSNLLYCEVRERYEHFRSRCTEENPVIFKINKSFKNKSFKNKFGKNKTLKNKFGKEKGCTEPLYGKKSKCIIKIVPQEEKGATFQMDKKCIKSRL